MKLSFLISFLVLFSFCKENSDTVPTFDNKETTDSLLTDDMKTGKTFLALGDSYTIGESVDEAERWPVQLVTKLNNDGLSFQEPKIIATTGWTTDELLAGIAADGVKDTFDLVSLLIGVNNQYRGYPINQQERDFATLLKKAIAFAGGDTSRVFVVSIPDYGVTPFGQQGDPEKIAKEIDEYNALNKTISDLYGVQYFNITPISREAAKDASLIADDKLHPSGKMYTRWVELIYDDVKVMLNE